MDIWFRIWVYILPFPMWLAEYFMRTSMNNPEAEDFFPSSLAAAALGMVIPVLSPKITVPPAETTIPAGTLLVYRRDEKLRRFGMAYLFYGTLLWLATVFLSIGGKWPDGWPAASIDQKFWIGIIMYVVAFALTEAKERI